MLTALPVVALLLAQPQGPQAYAAGAPFPTLTLRADDTKIDHSCRVELPPKMFIRDTNGDGVIHIAADNITVEFAPETTLRGSVPGATPDTMSGIGIRIDGHKGVTIRGGTISGFKVGLLATGAEALTIEDARFDDN